MRRWRQRTVSALALCVLAGLPVAGTVCMVVCSAADGSAASAVAGVPAHQHHHESPQADYAPSNAAQSRVGSWSEHDCGTHGGALSLGEATLAASRVDARVVAMTQGPVLAPAANLFSPSLDPLAAYSPPPDSASFAPLPLVLRV